MLAGQERQLSTNMLVTQLYSIDKIKEDWILQSIWKLYSVSQILDQ